MLQLDKLSTKMEDATMSVVVGYSLGGGATFRHLKFKPKMIDFLARKMTHI